MKTIDTLVTDIYALVQTRGWFNDELAADFGKQVAARLQAQLGEAPERTSSLRLSQMGPKCPRALWYSIHHPELAHTLPSWVTVKYSFGHIIEALAITLAKAAGHHVVGEQDEIVLDGVVGHRDCVVDGCVVDVKSTSSIGFSKFKTKDFYKDDSFGYLDQLDGYVVGSRMDPLVTVKDKGYILAVDKQLGHMVIYEHIVREEQIRKRIESYKRIVGSDHAPPCACGTRTEGKSGNIGLDVKASYSPYRYVCFPELRTFLYAHGPLYLTKVVRKPDVPEIDRFGNIV